MPRRPKKDDDAARLLTRITVDAEGDDEQLWALAETIASEVNLPADAFVVGEPVQVTAIDYEGDPRVGLLATCRRRDERHVVGFADLVFSPGSDGARLSAAYRTWLGLAPHDMSLGTPAPAGDPMPSPSIAADSRCGSSSPLVSSRRRSGAAHRRR
jgi:hypothetical protein